MKRVLIITQEEPFYIPKMLKTILDSQDENFKIHAFTVLKPHRKNKSIANWVLERAKIYTYWELVIVGVLFVYCKIFSMIFKRYSYLYSPKSVLKKYKVKEFFAKDINSNEYIDSLVKDNINVVTSISCPQLFGHKILNAFEWCLNAHGTLLPRHKGVFGSWWTLFEGDDFGGSTIHTMELKLDSGEIIWQEEFPVSNYDTQYSIAFKTKKQMGIGLVKCLKMINNDSVTVIPPKYKKSYHKAPTIIQGKKFHDKGLRIVTLRDVKRLIRSKQE